MPPALEFARPPPPAHPPGFEPREREERHHPRDSCMTLRMWAGPTVYYTMRYQVSDGRARATVRAFGLTFLDAPENGPALLTLPQGRRSDELVACANDVLVSHGVSLQRDAGGERLWLMYRAMAWPFDHDTFVLHGLDVQSLVATASARCRQGAAMGGGLVGGGGGAGKAPTHSSASWRTPAAPPPPPPAPPSPAASEASGAGADGGSGAGSGGSPDAGV